MIAPSAGHWPVPGTGVTYSTPGAASNTPAIARDSTHAWVTVSTAVRVPIRTPPAMYQRVARPRLSRRGSIGPFGAGGAAGGATEGTASGRTPPLALSLLGTPTD